MTMFDKLRAPFHPSKISWRVGSVKKDKTAGRALAYLDARDVMERLDEACGVGGWQSDCFDAGDGRLAAKIGIWVKDCWVWKCDGAGARQPNPGLSEMDANKGDFSDAFKRAAVQWGIGRYLYDVPAPWVDLDEYKRIKTGQQWKLDKALANASTQTPVNVDNQPSDPNLLSEQDSLAVYLAIETAIGLAKTVNDLETWSAKPDTIKAKQSLRPEHFESLKDTYRTAYRALQDAERVAA